MLIIEYLSRSLVHVSSGNCLSGLCKLSQQLGIHGAHYISTMLIEFLEASLENFPTQMQ